MRYDRDGDEHYDVALGADEVAARLGSRTRRCTILRGCSRQAISLGACRRILCSASEDIGLAYPQAVPIVKACVDSALQLGLPEARLPLAEAVIFLATAPKSNSGVMAIDAAMRRRPRRQERSARRASCRMSTPTARALSASRATNIRTTIPNHWVRQQYLPDALKDAHYYDYGDNKIEQAAKRYWDEIKK